MTAPAHAFAREGTHDVGIRCFTYGAGMSTQPKTMWRSTTAPICVVLLGPVALTACGDSTATTASATGTNTGGATVDPPTTGPTSTPTTSGGNSGETATTTAGSNSESNGMTTGGPTSATATTGAETASGSTGNLSGTDSTTTNTTPGTTGGGESSTGQAICEPGDGGGGGMVEKSFIWVPSEDLNDIAKIDTQTRVEVARYKTGPGTESPSRTSVSADGRFVVVNGRQSGRSTLFAANIEDCVDKNANGTIETSKNKDDVLPYMTDECMIWEHVWPYAGQFQDGPRGTTWTPGTWSYDECKYVDPKLWIGYQAAGGVAHFVRLDVTGTVEETIMVPGWNGQGYAPYGGALDPEFRPWFGGLRGEFLRVDTDLDPITVTRFTPPPETQIYGFTVDRDGDPWFAGCPGPVSTFNPETMTYTPAAGSNENSCHRGIAADEDYVWAASNDPCGLAQIDRKTKTLIQFHVPNPCSTAIGVSIDAEEFVWLIDQEGFAWKIDPDNVGAMKPMLIAGSHYVYSDMSGGQILSVLPQ